MFRNWYFPDSKFSVRGLMIREGLFISDSVIKKIIILGSLEVL